MAWRAPASPSEVLILLAEVSVAVAGFAGIVGAIAKPRGNIEQVDLKALVAGAVGEPFFWLVPLVISQVDAAREMLWGLAPAALASYAIWQ